MRITVKVLGEEQARRMLQRVANGPQRAVELTAEEVESFVETQVAKHSKSGRLFASVGKQRTSTGWFVGHNTGVAPHAQFLHWGTGLFGMKGQKYLIKPKRKKVLRWPGKGRFIFAKGVMHPGVKSDPWLTRAADQARTIFARNAQRVLSEDL